MKHLVFLLGAGHAHSEEEAKKMLSTTTVHAQDDLIVEKDRLLLDSDLDEEPAEKFCLDVSFPDDQQFMRTGVDFPSGFTIASLQQRLHQPRKSSWPCEKDMSSKMNDMIKVTETEEGPKVTVIEKGLGYVGVARMGQPCNITNEPGPWRIGRTGSVKCEDGETVPVRCVLKPDGEAVVEPQSSCPLRSASDECLLGYIENNERYFIEKVNGQQWKNYTSTSIYEARLKRFTTLTGKCIANGNTVTAKCVNQSIELEVEGSADNTCPDPEECSIGAIANHEWYRIEQVNSAEWGKSTFFKQMPLARFSTLTGRCVANDSVVTAKCVDKKVELEVDGSPYKTCPEPTS